MNQILRFEGEYRWLSNFWLCDIVFDGEHYSSVEHAYVAAKTLDPSLRRQIQNCTPGQAKRFGRKIELRPDWEQVKLGIMKDLVRQKFLLHKDLGKKLYDTGSADIVEGNTWHDNFYGVCLCFRCPKTGMNHLGRIIKEVRAELQSK